MGGWGEESGEKAFPKQMYAIMFTLDRNKVIRERALFTLGKMSPGFR